MPSSAGRLGLEDPLNRLTSKNDFLFSKRRNPGCCSAAPAVLSQTFPALLWRSLAQHHPALNDLCYAETATGSPGITKARQWFQTAADVGDISMQGTTWGVLYRYGKGVGQDYGKALERYQKTADADPDNTYAKQTLVYLRNHNKPFG
jgi:TPR repeat protein